MGLFDWLKKDKKQEPEPKNYMVDIYKSRIDTLNKRIELLDAENDRLTKKNYPSYPFSTDNKSLREENKALRAENKYLKNFKEYEYRRQKEVLLDRYENYDDDFDIDEKMASLDNLRARFNPSEKFLEKRLDEYRKEDEMYNKAFNSVFDLDKDKGQSIDR